MSTSQTVTTTNSSTAGPSRSRPIPPTPTGPAVREDEDLEDNDEEARKEAEERAARAAVVKKKVAQKEWARALRVQQQEVEVAERKRLLANAAVTSLPRFCVKEKGRNLMGTPTNQSNTQYASSLLSNLFNSKG
ncbi:hypothetical protein EV359DRAFT_87580 [Lentinula novae-zelandiae]|nr:hypothetical protein EV359DRAFT_87580 [Lentinula novae-zelandiae]